MLLERASDIAGVDIVAVARSAPLDGTARQRVSISLEGGARFLNGDPRSFDQTPDLHHVSSRYFDALGIPLRTGRVFTEDDDRSRTPVVIVNETMAKMHWPGERAVGKRVKYLNLRNASSPWAEVIGVVGDVRSQSLHDPAGPELYAPLNQLSMIGGRLKIILKARHDPVAMSGNVTVVFRNADPRLRVLRIETLQDVVTSSLSEQVYLAKLMGAFALLALVLASVGVYGLLNYAVTRRRREMAVRIALGASSYDIGALVFRRASALVLPGLAAGMVLASASTHILRGLLYDISPTDPVTFVFVPALFIGLAIAAGVAPTSRVTSLDPAIALHEE
jgi:predicted permease